jgi:hypothetical protein
MATKRSPRQASGTDQHERLVVGWFSFTCCEDSTILLTELLNDHLNEVIQVDDMVLGCPTKVPSFLQTLNKYLELFGIVQHAS